MSQKILVGANKTCWKWCLRQNRLCLFIHIQTNSARIEDTLAGLQNPNLN